MVSTKISLEKIYSLEKIPDLNDIHNDLAALVKAEHPEIYKSIRASNSFNPACDNILDAYKNLSHIFMLEKIPNFKQSPTVNPYVMIKKIFEKLGLPDNNIREEDICNKIKDIVDKNCGVLAEISLSRTL